jgi:hypothetical protein
MRINYSVWSATITTNASGEANLLIHMGDSLHLDWTFRNRASALHMWRLFVLSKGGPDRHLGQPLGLTADRAPIHIGQTYFDNNLDRVVVMGVNHIDGGLGREPVPWFETTHHMADGSRLAATFNGEKA